MPALLLWIALGVALSPSLVELAAHWLREPWSRYSALFAALWVACARSESLPRTPRADGYLLVLLGVALGAVAVGGGMGRFGRPGIALAVVGLARVLGAPSLPRALLAAWVVPVPNAVLAFVPGVESVTAAGVAAVASGFGLELAARPTLEGVELVAPAGGLALGPEHGGLPLAALLAGLGWYAVARRGGALPAAARGALRSAPWALALQPAAIALAAALLLAGAPGAAAALLQPGVWLAVAAVALRRIHGSAPAVAGVRTGSIGGAQP